MITCIYTPEGTPLQVSLSENAAFYGWKESKKGSGKLDVLVVTNKTEIESLDAARARLAGAGVADVTPVRRQCMRAGTWGIPSGSPERELVRYLVYDANKITDQVRDLYTAIGTTPNRFAPIESSLIEGSDITNRTAD